MSTQKVEELVARVASVVWRSSDMRYVIVKLDGQRTAVGPDSGPHHLRPGATFRFFGQWEEHERHGRQFRFASAAPDAPADKKGVAIYLEMTAPGVGEITAEKLWEAFGAQAVEVLRDRPLEVVRRGLLDAARAERASAALRADARWQTVRVELVGILAGRGFVLGDLLPTLIHRWGAQAPDRLRANPYALLLERFPGGCGWARVDKLYLDLGGDPARLKRQALACQHLCRSDSTGHTWLAAADLGRALVELIPTAEPVRAIRCGVRGGVLALRRVGAERWVADQGRAADEASAAEHARRLATYQEVCPEWTARPSRHSVPTSPISPAATSTTSGDSAA